MEPLFTVPLQKQKLSFQALTQALRELVTSSKYLPPTSYPGLYLATVLDLIARVPLATRLWFCCSCFIHNDLCLFNSVCVLVSIGRRLQDPLAELVKIEPKHLGIGMYQVREMSIKSQITGNLVPRVWERGWITGLMFRLQRLSSDLVLKSSLQMTRKMTKYHCVVG